MQSTMIECNDFNVKGNEARGIRGSGHFVFKYVVIVNSNVNININVSASLVSLLAAILCDQYSFYISSLISPQQYDPFIYFIRP